MTFNLLIFVRNKNLLFIVVFFWDFGHVYCVNFLKGVLVFSYLTVFIRSSGLCAIIVKHFCVKMQV